MENNRRSEISNFDVHRAFYSKQLRSKKHLENEKQYKIIIPEWLIKGEQTPSKKN